MPSSSPSQPPRVGRGFRTVAVAMMFVALPVFLLKTSGLDAWATTRESFLFDQGTWSPKACEHLYWLGLTIMWTSAALATALARNTPGRTLSIIGWIAGFVLTAVGLTWAGLTAPGLNPYAGHWFRTLHWCQTLPAVGGSVATAAAILTACVPRGGWRVALMPVPFLLIGVAGVWAEVIGVYLVQKALFATYVVSVMHTTTAVVGLLVPISVIGFVLTRALDAPAPRNER